MCVLSLNAGGGRGKISCANIGRERRVAILQRRHATLKIRRYTRDWNKRSFYYIWCNNIAILTLGNERGNFIVTGAFVSTFRYLLTTTILATLAVRVASSILNRRLFAARSDPRRIASRRK